MTGSAIGIESVIAAAAGIVADGCGPLGEQFSLELVEHEGDPFLIQYGGVVGGAQAG